VTVDGRVYHDPAFQAVLESYHVSALTAHQQSARVVLPLPRPPVPDPETDAVAAATVKSQLPPTGAS
jgi:hypothetical protein